MIAACDLCDNCLCELTPTDFTVGACTQCKTKIGESMSNETCKHGTEPIYRCPDNADHDEVSLSDKPGECSKCGAELETV